MVMVAMVMLVFLISHHHKRAYGRTEMQPLQVVQILVFHPCHPRASSDGWPHLEKDGDGNVDGGDGGWPGYNTP